MSEYLYDYDTCGADMSLFLLHRLISLGYELGGAPESESTIVSHPFQLDLIRIALLGLSEKHLQDPLLNPLLRVKNWITEPSLSPTEIFLETPKGKCRMFNLNKAGLLYGQR